nr:hypothetical protein [Tanacetum cinerariifolium]
MFRGRGGFNSCACSFARCRAVVVRGGGERRYFPGDISGDMSPGKELVCRLASSLWLLLQKTQDTIPHAKKKNGLDAETQATQYAFPVIYAGVHIVRPLITIKMLKYLKHFALLSHMLESITGHCMAAAGSLEPITTIKQMVQPVNNQFPYQIH